MTSWSREQASSSSGSDSSSTTSSVWGWSVWSKPSSWGISLATDDSSNPSASASPPTPHLPGSPATPGLSEPVVSDSLASGLVVQAAEPEPEEGFFWQLLKSQ